MDHEPVHVDPSFAIKLALKHFSCRVGKDVDELQPHLNTRSKIEILQEACGLQAVIPWRFLPPKAVKE
jgi:hypothetical protein